MASVTEASDQQTPTDQKPDSRKDVTCVEGVVVPPKKYGKVRMEDHIPSLRKMKLRQDDMFLCSYPKAGTHWTWEIMYMLVQGKVKYEDRTKVQLMVEFVDVEKLDELPSPRILNTHLPFSVLPVQEMQDKRTKIVHVYRNPKDSFVSMYFHAKSAGYDVGAMDFEPFVELCLSDNAFYGGYPGYLRQMHDFQQANPDVPIFHLMYEDMKKDPVGNVRRLADFLQVEVSDQLCEDIALACSFRKMKEGAKDKKPIDFGGNEVEHLTAEAKEAAGEGNKPGPVIFRKGEAGDWKNHLTAAMSAKIDAMVMENMKNLPFTMKYE